MSNSIGIASWFERFDDRRLIDVRTPAEYARGHIPGAINLPLFTDEERAVVGTAYKQESPETALLKGLDFVGPKMRSFVEQAKEVAPGGRLTVHCWRGGRRSESMGWLLRLAGFDVLTIAGGYKAYRNHILEVFEERDLKLIVLGGYTGSGKTEVLQALARRGEQIIDLEGLAHHKGSAFGALGELEQPTVEQFENDLFEVMRRIDPDRRVWIEDESQSIGRVYVPGGLWRRMREAPLLALDIPREERIRRLVASYASFEPAHLADAFERIQKRLGGQHVMTALAALRDSDYEKAASIALRYYDKAYRFGLEKRPEQQRFHLETPVIQPEATADELIRFAREHLAVLS